MTPTRLDTLILLAAHQRALGCGTRFEELITETGSPYSTWAYRVRMLVRAGLVAGWRVDLWRNELEYRLTAAGWEELYRLGVIGERLAA
jgi:hypothetical protein